MKVGSIVECINNSQEKCLQLNTPYTIREILPKGTQVRNSQEKLVSLTSVVTVRLEEIKHDEETIIMFSKVIFFDVPFHIEIFRELLPPIENVEEHINENTLEPVLI